MTDDEIRDRIADELAGLTVHTDPDGFLDRRAAAYLAEMLVPTVREIAHDVEEAP